MLKSPIYLDFNATAPLSQSVLSEMPQLLQLWGNPSSIHLASRGPKTILRETRKKLADYLKVSSLEIIFNSGASEGNNTVLKSVWNTFRPGNHIGQPVKNEFLMSAVEHPSITKTAQFLETEGAVVHWIPVSREGLLDLGFIKEKLNERTALLSCMFANNETGTVFPIKEIVALAKTKNVLVHSDCVQAFGKTDFNLQDLGVDYATVSAHKFYALKGCGALFVRKNAPYINLVHGGGQERSRRGGTENILGIASLGVMLDQLSHVSEKEKEVKKLRDYFEVEVKTEIPNVSITCGDSNRLANTSSLVITGVDGETLLVSLDLKGFAVSTGAACSSGNPEPSPVLLAVGLTREEAQNSLRVSLGWTTTQEHIDLFIHHLVEVVARLRAINEEAANV
jgi:cysteine desulfurase